MELVIGAFIKCSFKKSDGTLNDDVCSTCVQHHNDLLTFYSRHVIFFQETDTLSKMCVT
jgi:hypothetical protein